MQDKNKIPLTSAEIAGLWTSYMNDSLSVCVMKYFLSKAEDEDVKPHLQSALQSSGQHLQNITYFFNQEGMPVPQGFTDNDVNINAPRLYSDAFTLFYLCHMYAIGMAAYSTTLNQVTRPDIRGYFTEANKSSMDQYNKVTDTLLANGIAIRAPRVEVPKEVSFIKKHNFMSGIFGEQRPLLVTEIVHLFKNVLTNLLGRSLITGFGQVSKIKEVKDYMFRGADISSKHEKVFSTLLSNEDIPIPSTYEMFVTDSTTPPFSDKLMMFHISALNAAGIGNYGIASAASLRADIITNYMRLSGEIAQYAEDGINIMIDNEWMEQPPQAIKHKKLTEA